LVSYIGKRKRQKLFISLNKRRVKVHKQKTIEILSTNHIYLFILLAVEFWLASRCNYGVRVRLSARRRWRRRPAWWRRWWRCRRFSFTYPLQFLTTYCTYAVATNISWPITCLELVAIINLKNI
jgi:hypothetical protein